MTDTPTRSLRASSNPQARMQELLKAHKEPDTDITTLPVVEATILPVVEATGNIVASTTALPDSSTTSSIVAQAESSVPAQTRRRPERKASVGKVGGDVPAQPSPDPAKPNPDLVRMAMLEMLAQPYPEDMREGMMTVTSVKIPKPIWERLEYARTLTKKDKQDIIADALQLYFDRIVKGQET